MAGQMEIRKTGREEAPQHAQKTTRQSRSQTLQEPQNSQTPCMGSKITYGSLSPEQISQPLSKNKQSHVRMWRKRRNRTTLPTTM